VRLRLCLLLMLLVVALAAAPGAWANADPASDVLYTQDVYLPYNNLVPVALGEQLTEDIENANDGGYPIKVAVIGSRNDLGLIQQLWLKPRLYAPFLGRELLFLYRDNLLVVMPNGFGFFRNNEDVSDEERLLGRIKVAPGGAGLGQATRVAVRRLAAAAGHPVRPGGGSPWIERAAIAGGALVVLIALVFAGRELRRRRRPSELGADQEQHDDPRDAARGEGGERGAEA
jgi:hypothetical protein